MGNVTTSTTVDNFMQAADSAAARTILGTPAVTTTISAGTGLTGGGDLSANRTLAVSYGTTAGTAAQGNDSRLFDPRTPTAHAFTHTSGGSDQITSLALSTGTISTTPSSALDIVNKSYADSIGSGVNFHDACDYGTIAVLSPSATYNQPGGAGVGVNATLTGSTNAPLVVDGVTVATGKRILVKNQTSTFQNGIYNVTQQGDGSTVPYILTRASDYDTSGSGINEVQAGDFVIVLNGTLANTAWVQQSPAPINFGVTAINFIQFAAANAGVTSFNTSLSGLTPSSNTTGAVTLAGTLGLSSGGTGATTAQGAINTLAGATTNGQFLRGNGTNVVMSAIQVSDVPTLNQNTTGTAANVTGVVAVANGGTGASTTEAARNVFGSPQVVTVRHSGIVGLATAGTLTGATWTGGSAVITFTSSSITPVVGMSLSTGITTGVIRSVDSATQITMTLPAGSSGSGTVNLLNSSVSTLVSNSVFSVDGRTLQVGDIVCLMGQTATAQQGPWVVTAIGTGISFVRPTWFPSTLTGSALFSVQLGTSNSATYVSVFPTTANSTATIGVDGLTAVTVTWRATTATLAGNTFTSKQTLAAGSTTGAPLAFQAGVLLTTPVAHSVEWDGTSMYLTTSALERRTVLAYTGTPTAGQWLTWDGVNSKFVPNTNAAFDASGNMVIGTGSPGAKLDVVGSSATDIFHVRSGTTYFTAGATDGTQAEINAYQTSVGPKLLAIQSAGGATSFGGNAYASAGTTTMTGGFIWIASAAGAPTGVPASAPSGRVPMYYDTTANKLYVYNGSWKASAAFA